MTSEQIKQELLQQLNLEQKGIKIYGGGGIKFAVSDKDLQKDLPGARHVNKEKLKQDVIEKVNQLEKEF